MKGRRVWLEATAVDDEIPHVVEVELPKGAPAAQTEARFIRSIPGRLPFHDSAPPRRGNSIVLGRATGGGLWLYRDERAEPVPLEGDGAQFAGPRLLTWGKALHVYEAETGRLNFAVPFRSNTYAGGAESWVQDEVWFQFLAREPCGEGAEWVRMVDLAKQRVVFEAPEAVATALGPSRKLLAVLLPDAKGGVGGAVSLWRLVPRGDAKTLVKLGTRPIKPGLDEGPDAQFDDDGRRLNILRCASPGDLGGDRVVQVLDVQSLRMSPTNTPFGGAQAPPYMAEIQLKPAGTVPVAGREVLGSGVFGLAFAGSRDRKTWAMVTGKRVATGTHKPAYVETNLVIVDAMTRRITIRQRLPAVDGPDGRVALRLSEDGRWAHLVRKAGGPLLFDAKTEAFMELDPKSAGGELETTHYLSDYEVVELDTGRRWVMPFARRP